jgi:orotate phosphoribosyltransferase/AMMECR1 domain-containing protein
MERNGGPEWRLLRELLGKALLFSTDERPIRTRAGHRMPWLFDPWPVSLTEAGSRLIGRCLVDELAERFSSTQLAARGFRALPMMAACIREGDGRYSGLAIRDVRKSYGSGRLIEGGDPSKSVVIIDDSLATGTSLREAVKALEEAGYRVEGCLSLVIFTGRGGDRWARSMGYRVASVFDVWVDLDFPRSSPSWTTRPPEIKWSGRSTASDLGRYAKEVVTQYALNGDAPLPSTALERRHQGVSGIFVSLRDANCAVRLARRGFILVPGFNRTENLGGEAARDVARVAVETVKAARRAVPYSRLTDSAVAVTIFGQLEPISPRNIDAAELGIVVVNEAEPWHVGAVLPHVEDVGSDLRQYQKACRRANVDSSAPHKLYRHTVAKYVSPNANWHKFGVPARPLDHRLAELVDAMAADVVSRLTRASPVDEARESKKEYLDLAQAGDLTAGISLRLYADGWQCAESLTLGEMGADPVGCALGQFFSDPGLQPQLSAAKRLAGVLTVLHSPRTLPGPSVEKLSGQFRLGIDTLAAESSGKLATMPSFTPAQHSWTETETVRAVLADLGMNDSDVRWMAYESDVRVCRSDGSTSTVTGSLSRTERLPAIELTTQIERIASHIMAHLGTDGLPSYQYEPLVDRVDRQGTIGRKALALKALGLAGEYLHRRDLLTAALAGVGTFQWGLEHGDADRPLEMGGMLGGPPSDGLLLDALCELGVVRTPSPGVTSLIHRVQKRFSADGFVATSRGTSFRQQDHGILAGIQICAAARALAAAEADEWDLQVRLHRAFPWYARRFVERPTWDMVWWHCQAWSALPQHARIPEYTRFVAELADWAVARQLDKDGSFLTNLQPQSPSFHTACVAEGIVEAASLARDAADDSRWEKYALAWAQAMGFMNLLTIDYDDVFCVPKPELALGGVRFSPRSWSLRIDVAAHYLIALVKGAKLFEVSSTSELRQGRG